MLRLDLNSKRKKSRLMNSDPPPAICVCLCTKVVECSTNAILIRISEQYRGVGLFVDNATLALAFHYAVRHPPPRPKSYF